MQEMTAQAMFEAAQMKAAAEAEVEQMRARVIADALKEAEEQIAAMKAQAEAEAARIKADAARDAQEVMRMVQADCAQDDSSEGTKDSPAPLSTQVVDMTIADEGEDWQMLAQSEDIDD